MLISCLKGRHSTDNPQTIPTLFKITLSFEQFLKIVETMAEQRYPIDHIFVTNYLHTVININNQQMAKEFKLFKETVKEKEIPVKKIYTFCMEWIKQKQISPIYTILSIWQAYIIQEIQLIQQGTVQFLTHEIKLITQTIISIIKKVLTSNGVIKQELIKFQMHLLDVISRFQIFSDVMKMYLDNFQRRKGINYQFTPEQVQQSKIALQKLVKISQIKRPFGLTTQKLNKFNQESTLVKKILLLVDSVAQVREEIQDYRKQHKLPALVIGGDEVTMSLNFACQKTTSNILASSAYIDIFIGHSQELKQQLLNKVDSSALYNLSLLEIVGSVYCHASQIQ